MKYFKTGLTPQEYKREYLRLCKELHPDRGGNEKAFIEMRNEYEQLLRDKVTGDATGKTQEWRKMLISFIRSQYPDIALMIDTVVNSEYFYFMKQFIPKEYSDIIKLLTDEDNKN